MAANIANNYNDLCRICATKTSMLVGLNIFEGEGNTREIMKKISSCLPIQVHNEDQLPKMVCSECVFKLELFFNFRQKSLETELMLVAMVKKLNDCAMNKVVSNSVNNSLGGAELMYEQLGDPGALLALGGSEEALAGYMAPQFTNDHAHLVHLTDVDTHQQEQTNKLPLITLKNDMLNVKVELVKDEPRTGQGGVSITEESCSSESPVQWTASEATVTTIQQPYFNIQSQNNHGESSYYVSAGEGVANGTVAVQWCYCELCGCELSDKHVLHNCTTQQQQPYEALVPQDQQPEQPQPQPQPQCSEEDEEDSDAEVEEEVQADEQESEEQEESEEVPLDQVPDKTTSRRCAKPKTCESCGKTYKSNYKLREHMRRHTGERPFACQTCKKQFSSKMGLAQHEATHTGLFRYECVTCGKGFECRSYLSVHQRVHSLDRPYPCDTCQQAFKTKQSLKDHVNRHLGVKPYTCDTCGRAFITKGLWRTHQRVHEPTEKRVGRHPCSTCGKQFVSKSYLATHRRIHSGEKPFMCEVCGKGFVTRVDLRIHSTMHTGEKSFVCETCGKAFARCHALRIHSRSHTGERPYTCDVCGQTFTQFSPMAIHRRLHTGERPYACDLCQKTFVSRSTMSAHRKRHVPSDRPTESVSNQTKPAAT